MHGTTSEISNAYITSIVQHKNTLWHSSLTNGLISHYPALSLVEYIQENNSQLISNQIYDLNLVKNSNLWLGTAKGLQLFDIEKRQFKAPSSSSSDLVLLPDVPIRKILASDRNGLWVGTNNGLYLLRNNTNALEPMKFPNSITPIVRSIVEDHDGKTWIGTNEGLFFVDPLSNKLSKDTRFIDEQYVLSILEDSENNLWFGTSMDGLHRVTPSGLHSHFKNDRGDDSSLGDTAVLALYQDRSGIIWAGTYNAGIHWFDPHKYTLGASNKSLSSYPCMNSDLIFSSQPLSENRVLVGTEVGLTLLNINTRKCTHFTHSDDINSISDDSVLTIFEDSQKLIWLGTSEGLDRLDLATGGVTRFGSQIQNKNVYTINESKNGNLVIGTVSGIYISDTSKSEFRQTSIDIKSKNIRIQTSDKDINGNIWFGSDHGLLMLDNELKKLNLEFVEQDPTIITNIRSVHVLAESVNYIPNGYFRRSTF